MAVRKSGIRWRSDTLTPTLARFTITANIAVNAAARDLAKEIEEYMKQHAPWEDRSGDAREGLYAQVENHGFKVLIHLGHGVEYGLWLEVRWNGVYSIIVPTLEKYQGAEFWENFRGIMGAAAISRAGSVLT